MDLITGLTKTLDVSADQAEALAGALLGSLQQQLRAAGATAHAERVAEAIPELPGWKRRAAAALGVVPLEGVAGGRASGRQGESPAGLGGLADGITKLLGKAGLANEGLDISFLTTLFSELGFDPTAAPRAAPLFGEFIQVRLPAEDARRLVETAPFLASGHASGALGRVW